jgi:hypothetical protein
MKSRFKKQLQKKHERFKQNLEVLYEYFNKKYPGWENTEDSDHIKKRLRQTARKITDNRMKKKIKKLDKKDFPDWPFKQDTLILVQTSKKMVSVIIDFQEYALNGLAESALNLKTVYLAGKVKKGKSISKFIQLGLEL